jgi:hypothetical protein
VCTATFGLLQGTSVAATQVGGLSGLVLSRYGNIGGTGLSSHFAIMAKESAGTVMAGANCTGTKAYNGFHGCGIVDALCAVQGI